MIDHEKRKTSIGASEVAALMDESPWMSRYSLWALKCGLISPEEVFHDSERLKIGRELEKPILDIWAAREKVHYKHNTQSVSRDDLPGLSATPDGYMYDGRIDIGNKCAAIDAKTVSYSERKDWLAGLPRYYWWQLQAQTLVTKMPRAWLVALFGVDEISATVVDADPDAHLRIVSETARFWSQVSGDLHPPDPLDHKASTAAMMGMRREPGSVFQLDDSAHEIAIKLEFAKNDEKTAKKQVALFKNQLLEKLGNHECGIFTDGTGYRVTTVSKKEYTVKASVSKRLTAFKNEQAEGEDDE